MSAMMIKGRTYFYKVLGKMRINFLLNIVMSAMMIKGRTYFYKVLDKLLIIFLSKIVMSAVLIKVGHTSIKS